MDIDHRESLYMMALSMVPGLSCKNQRLLIDAVGSAGEVYANRAELDAVVGRANSKVVEALSHIGEYLPRCEQELEWAERNKISCLTINDEAYPQRLKLCEDAPLVLYYRGTADLNASHIVSMVGTRKISDYGKRLCDSFVRDLSQLVPDVIVMSGLAYGTDVHCHRAALDYGLDTVGVLAHGLDRIYPALHRDTAARIVGHGGLLTEFVSGTGITRYNFLQRNRIVAGCADATIVGKHGVGVRTRSLRLSRPCDRRDFVGVQQSDCTQCSFAFARCREFCRLYGLAGSPQTQRESASRSAD